MAKEHHFKKILSLAGSNLVLILKISILKARHLIFGVKSHSIQSSFIPVQSVEGLFLFPLTITKQV